MSAESGPGGLLSEYPIVLTVDDVALITRRSVSATYAWLRSGAVHTVRIAGSLRVLRSALEAYLISGGADGQT